LGESKDRVSPFDPAHLNRYLRDERAQEARREHRDDHADPNARLVAVKDLRDLDSRVVRRGGDEPCQTPEPVCGDVRRRAAQQPSS
jgi:hypothetical protein